MARVRIPESNEAQSIEVSQIDLQVKPRRTLRHDRFGHGVYVPLSQQHVGLALEFNFSAILWFEKHPVTDQKGAYVRADRNNLGPGQTSTDFGGCGDHNSTGRAAFAVRSIGPDENSIVEQLDGQRRIHHRCVNHGYQDV